MKNAGVNRLAVLVGTLTACALIIPYLSERYESMLNGDVLIVEYAMLLLAVSVCFCVPVALVRAVYWVYLGFKPHPEEEASEKPDVR